MTEEKAQITDGTENCVWFDGKTVYEVSFCEEFLKENPMMYVDGVFYNCNGAVDVQIIEKMISDRLKEQQVQKDFAKKIRSRYAKGIGTAVSKLSDIFKKKKGAIVGLSILGMLIFMII